MAVWAFLTVLRRTTIVLEEPLAFLACLHLVVLFEAFTTAVVGVGEHCRALVGARGAHLAASHWCWHGVRVPSVLHVPSLLQDMLLAHSVQVVSSYHCDPFFAGLCPHLHPLDDIIKILGLELLQRLELLVQLGNSSYRQDPVVWLVFVKLQGFHQYGVL